MATITAVKKRGNNQGTILMPHRYGGGFYLVSKGGLGGNLKESAIPVRNLNELTSWISQGYGVRMSGPGVPPSIYMPNSLVLGN